MWIYDVKRVIFIQCAVAAEKKTQTKQARDYSTVSKVTEISSLPFRRK